MSTQTDRENARLALKHRLYVSGWELSGILRDIRDGKLGDCEVQLHKIDEVPVGVIVHDRSDNDFMIFVKKAYRRRGIGTRLVKSIKDKANGETRAFYGTIGSNIFWMRQGISV